MTIPNFRHALIIGAGSGLSASFARKAAHNDVQVSVASRHPGALANLCGEINGRAYEVDSSSLTSIRKLFSAVEADANPPDIVLYNPSARVPGGITEVDAERVNQAIAVTAMGGFYAAQEAARRMLAAGHGAILFTGATASVSARASSTAFAMGKFALRALAQSLARELHPQGIHIGHFVIDGGIENSNRPGREADSSRPDAWLHPDAIAEVYWQHLRQDRSCWSWEVELRPWVEKF